MVRNRQVSADILQNGEKTYDGHCNSWLSLHFSDISQLCNSKGDAIKECYAALLSLLVEAARHDTDPDTLSVTLLQNYNFSAQRCEKLVGIYRQHKTKLQAALSNVGTHPPHIIDASWTLDYCVKVSQHCKLNELVIQRCWCKVEVPASISSSCLHSVPDGMPDICFIYNKHSHCLYYVRSAGTSPQC